MIQDDKIAGLFNFSSAICKLYNVRVHEFTLSLRILHIICKNLNGNNCWRHFFGVISTVMLKTKLLRTLHCIVQDATVQPDICATRHIICESSSLEFCSSWNST